MLESLIAAVTPFRPGWIELPEAYGAKVWGLTKGRTHKYIKRVPKAGGGYRYYYNVAHGGGVHHADHFVEGASFRHGDGHYHITHASGDHVTIKHDESGHTHTLSKAELGKTLREHHASALKAHHEKAAKDLADAKAAGASPKQIAKLESRAKVGAEDKPKAPIAPASQPADDRPTRPDGDETERATRQKRVAEAYRKHPEIGVLNRRLSELLIARRRASETSQRVGIPLFTGAPAPTQATRDAARADVARLNEEIRAAAAAVDAALDLAEGKTSPPPPPPPPPSADDKPKAPAVIQLTWERIPSAVNSAGHPVLIGQVKKHGDGYVTITDTKSKFIPSEGLSMGMASDRGTLHTATARESTPDEIEAYKAHVASGKDGPAMSPRAAEIYDAAKAAKSPSAPAVDPKGPLAEHVAAATKRGIVLADAGTDVRGAHLAYPTGNTYGHKDRIKFAGGTWDPGRKAWIVPVSNLRRLLKGKLTAPEWFAWTSACL